MPNYSLMWIDLEDPKASKDKVANAAFIKPGFDACTGRIFSGCYSNEGALDRTVGDELDLTGYPYFRASGDGNPDVNDVPRLGMHVSYEQYKLDTWVDGFKVDLDVRRLDNGTIEFGLDMSNHTGMPSAQWFVNRYNDPQHPVRFIIFGDAFPYITAAQVANAEAANVPFDFQLYTYINMPGGDYYGDLDAYQQVTRALDSLGVPSAAQPPVQPAVEASSFMVLGDETISVTLRKV